MDLTVSEAIDALSTNYDELRIQIGILKLNRQTEPDLKKQKGYSEVIHIAERNSTQLAKDQIGYINISGVNQ